MDTLVNKLRRLLKAGQVLSDPEELLVYECDGLTHYKHRPRAVVFPSSTEEVAAVVRVLADEGVPVVPRGAGTGLSGGALAVGGGVCVELARMRRILKVDADNRLAVVEAGVVNAHVSRAVARHGLHYVPDPSSQGSCTVGGNIAENAGGIHCLKYGTTVDHVLAARVVLSDGSIVDLGGAAGQTGYDLLGLFVGSEGTFGITTEATLRLTPAAPAVRTLLADFADIDDASRAVSAVIAAGIIPAGLEMVDNVTIRAVEASVFAAGMPLDAGAALLVELDGLEAGLDEEVARVREICEQNGARTVRLAADELERKKLWAARKGAFGAMGRVSPDILIQDAVVPRSRLPEVLAATYRIGAQHQLLVANVFHAGDGNLHPLICFDSRDASQVERVRAAGREIMETCVSAGGTITGEHGVGLDKRDYLPLVFSDDDLRAMLRVRAAFDPAGLFNPGKIIPALKGCGEGRAVATQDALPQRPAARRDSLQIPPDSIEEAREVLRDAASSGRAVVPSGGGTWLDAGDELTRGHVRLNTSRMRGAIRHEPADLVATAGAGLTLEEFNREVGRAGQWLPLDPPDDGRATLGGVAATGLGGAQALSYGLPRSYVLGMRVLLADGRVVNCGSRVVKNVAGYDLCKLFVGSHGTLGVILELTFKLRPRPAREATLVARSPELSPLLRASRALVSSQLLPSAVEIVSPALASSFTVRDTPEEFHLLARFAGTHGAVEYQLKRAREMTKEAAGRASMEVMEDDAPLWNALAAAPLVHGGQLALRTRVLPSELGRLLSDLHLVEAAPPGVMWHAGAGDGRLHVFGTESLSDADAVIFRRRFSSSLTDAVRTLTARIKGQLDPENLFSPGRFIQ
ncbi:MAG TPA: FAD-linked oxidase C-terminal domain-containing protein [Pyrinomonadaceae bacterium]|nr:FAD-linked oxidase C-terminal domain-containing protein [Pyrinomonadaceae bacterium]